VLEIQEFQNEAPALHRWHRASLRNPWRVVALFVGIIGGFCCAVILSTLLAHPAGAAVLPGPNGGLLSQPPDNVVQSVSSATTAIPDSASTPVNDVGGPRAATDLDLAQQTLSPAITTTLQPAALVLKPVIAAALNPVIRPVSESGLLSVLNSGQPSAHHTSATRATPQARPAATFMAFDTQPTAPMPIPTPNGPTPQVPVTPSGTNTDGSSPSFGSGALAGHPTLGLLMPAPIITWLLFGRSESPRLLLDLRTSPPG
jgi:hypothetical protein